MTTIQHSSLTANALDRAPRPILTHYSRSTTATPFRIPGARGPNVPTDLTVPTDRFITFYFMPEETQLLSEVYMDVATASAGSTGQWLIYRVDRFGNVDRSEIIANGSLDTTVAGPTTFTLTNAVQIVEKQLYAFSFVQSGGGSVDLEAMTFTPITYAPEVRIDATNWYAVGYTYADSVTAHTVSASTIPNATWDAASSSGPVAFALFGFSDVVHEEDEPTVSFIYPQQGDVIKAGESNINVEVLDASAIKRVYLDIRDTTTGTTMYWNGFSWQSTYTQVQVPFPAGGSASKTSYPVTFPAASTFLIAVYAHDEWGNVNSPPPLITFSS